MSNLINNLIKRLNLIFAFMLFLESIFNNYNSLIANQNNTSKPNIIIIFTDDQGYLYGDVVEEFDFETGRLFDKVDELGLRDNTLIIYTTDNGPCNQPRYTKKKAKDHPEGSIFWGDSTPLRNGKGSCYEGGSRVPCIVRWPGKFPANQTSDAIFATVDFMPTFANLADFKVPTDRVIDGVDQCDLLLGKSEEGARNTFFYQGNGVRKGKWKYLKAERSREVRSWQ